MNPRNDARSLFFFALAALTVAGCNASLAPSDEATGTNNADELEANNTVGGEANNAGGNRDTGSSNNVPTDPGANEQETELAFPDAPTNSVDAWYTGRSLTLQSVGDHYVYEGDILLPPDMVTTEEVQLVFEPGEEPTFSEEYNRLTGRANNLWEDNQVAYAIDPALPDQARVTDAIAHWEANTNLSFVPRTDQTDYIWFARGTGCSSYVGRIGGKQQLTLHDACSTGNAIHEIGHAVGLWHEHSRADRDNWVTIHWDNVASGREYNFKTYVEGGWDGQELTDELDLGSIMMYSSYAFSSNGQPTITRTDGSTFSMQRQALSAEDIAGLDALYPADGGEPEYVNGEWYTINGLTVMYYYGYWYYVSRYGLKRVELIRGNWYYV